MAAAESGELEKYRKYIQKRRITTPSDDDVKAEPEENSITALNRTEPESRSDSQTPWWEKEAYTLLDRDELIKPPQEQGRPVHHHNCERNNLASTLHYSGRNHALYKKLYARQGNRTPAASSYRNISSQRAQIEDNRATLMAIKLIKQSLACFAILGIIVLMQGRSDMQEALAVIRRHVVETHIDPRSLFEDVKSVFSQFVQALVGSP